MKVSVCMILKNEEMFISQALKSTLPVAAEYCIVDNMSTDRTREKVIEFQKKNGIRVKMIESDSRDLAYLRNLSMDMASAEWILCSDGDEIFYNEGDHNIRTLMSKMDLLTETDEDFRDNKSLVHLPFYHFYGSFNHILEADVSPVVRLIRVNRKIQWVYPQEGVLVHEFPFDPTFSKEEQEKCKTYAETHYAHYGYCKPNKEIWAKGLDYENRGHFNYLHRKPEDEVLNGTPVKVFEDDHPSAMRSFPFYKFRTDIEEKNGQLLIQKKHW